MNATGFTAADVPRDRVWILDLIAPDAGARRAALERHRLLLEVLTRGGVRPDLRDDLEDLVIRALRRTYRCKDWHYAAVARHVDSPAFRDRLRSDPALDERARFVVFALDHSDRHLTRVSYQRWQQNPQ